MFKSPIVSPSILSADFLCIAEELDAIAAAGAPWIHYDVMDGHFVPNISIGIPLLKQIRKATDKVLDLHLMVSNPLIQLPWFLECNPNVVTIHYEALSEGMQEAESRQAVELIHAAGAKAGIALKPDTPTCVLDPMLELWDMILVMSVYPGFSGQSYLPESADRLRCVVETCKKLGLSPLIQVDGGIDSKTAPLLAAFGADVFVAGNAVFKSDDYRGAISSIVEAASDAQHSACS